MPFHSLLEEDLRRYSKNTLESLEYWLRRLIDETLSKVYGANYFDCKDINGNNLVNAQIKSTLKERVLKEPQRYPRLIDAALLDTAVDIICNPTLYNKYFSDALKMAFPEGNSEARSFIKRLIIPRNHLAHANPITIRQAEQIICYSHDIIDSLKKIIIGG